MARPACSGRCGVGAALALALLLATAGGAAAASEFRSVGPSAAVLYDAPSRQGSRLFVAPGGMPLEVISTLGQWVKVRDVAGDVVWIERGALSDRRTVVATQVVAVRAAAQETAAIVMHADRGVVLELVEPRDPATPPGWVPVRHREGGAGFVRSAEVWGD